ncbi:mechanosensitive ion channel protein 8-like isoform X2 [Carya illinoinensis]|uniref:mechanosensitive ion channel protein 8-like isoform X2 n=1 Tax=Carya illinoinensis TaxID=32201 RepID=UPI001C71FD2C|nr:mechanosensitive ion channel protein 8-like isoform X2 [Carya illinoinensis]
MHSPSTVEILRYKCVLHYDQEERQALLHHYQNHGRMAKREEVVVTFDDVIGCSNEPVDVSKNGRGSLSKNSQGSPEMLVSPRSESVGGKNKDFSVEEEVLRCSSNAAFRRDPWRYVLSRKSRLIDPPEDPCQGSERGVNSERVLRKDEDYEDDDIEDIPQEYKKSLKFSTLTSLQLVLASTFHVNTFFERIREALFKQFVIETLSTPPSFRGHNTREEAMAEVQQLKKDGVTELWATLLPRVGRSGELQNGPTVGKKHPFSSFSSKRRDEEVAVDRLHKLNQKTISAWNMGKMIDIIRHGALSTLDEQIRSSNIEDEALLQITSECKAKEAAKRIFQNVVKPGSRNIYLEDLMRFMSQDKALETMRLFGVAAGKNGISKSSLKSWMVIAFRERRALALSLDDTKTAVDELRNMLNVLVAIIILIIWFIILGVPITHFLVFMSSQLLLVGFIFGNTCKTVFEAIVFLFMMHPFDVGDRCEVDGVQMIVDEMNILTTVFLRKDHQKIIYPNSILATKPIGNYQRSPHMVDAIDFCIHVSTPLDKVSTMKERITRYIESKNEHWHPAPMVIMREVIDMNKLMMTVWATHQMNFQEMGERWSRRALLIEEMVKVFREVDIEYRMLPLDVNIRNMPPLISDRLPSNWTTCASR